MAVRTRIVLQARTSSNRLPAKSLLPVGGLPLAVLCARRLGIAGQEVVLATSDDPSDDLLALVAEHAGVKVSRGSLVNVLQRFLDCVADLQDDDIVVRATADNPVPDGRFVADLIATFVATGREYVGTASPDDGLPYGLSAEVFTAGALRAIAKGPCSSQDLEHVTTTLRCKAGAGGIVARGTYFSDDLSHLRASIDTLEDYLAVAKVFAEVSDAASEDWKALVRRFAAAAGSAVAQGQRTKRVGELGYLTLGTVQLGERYGVANRTGRPDDAETVAMLELAARSGVRQLDTARIYGDAEARIGRLLPRHFASTVKLSTKLQPLRTIPDDASAREVRAAVDASVFRSCRELCRSRLDVLMFHHSPDMFRWGGAALERLAELVGEDVIGALGASVYTPDEAVKCLAEERITHLQIPFNLVDARWLGGSFAAALAKRRDAQVHARSVFLQGLLVNDADRWPAWVSLRRELVARIESLVQRMKRESRVDLCLAYVRSFPWVSSVVIGAETLQQLKNIVTLASETALSPEQAAAVPAEFSDVPARLLNPAAW